VRALAADNGLEVCEWLAPTPTSWEDHLYHNRAGVCTTYPPMRLVVRPIRATYLFIVQRSIASDAGQSDSGKNPQRSSVLSPLPMHAGLPYESKMDAFEAFIARATRFRSLPLLPSRPTVPPPATADSTELPSPTQAAEDGSQSVSQAPTEFDENDLPNDVYERMMLDLERRQSGNSAANSRPSPPTRLVLLDDLPYAHDKPQRARLAAVVQVCPHRLHQLNVNGLHTDEFPCEHGPVNGDVPPAAR
jgi:hypothetical protein